MNGDREFTKNGYRKKPSCETLLNFISRSISKITKKTASKAFRLCGVDEDHINTNRGNINSKFDYFLNGNLINGSEFQIDQDSTSDEENSESLNIEE